MTPKGQGHGERRSNLGTSRFIHRTLSFVASPESPRLALRPSKVAFEKLALAASAPNLASLSVSNIWVLAPTEPIKPVPNLTHLSITYNACHCDKNCDQTVFSCASGLDRSNKPVFPNLKSLRILGSKSLSFAQIRRHCPKLVEMECGFWRCDLECEMFNAPPDADLVAMIKGSLEKLTVLARDHENHDTLSTELVRRYYSFEKELREASDGRLDMEWEIEGGLTSFVVAFEMMSMAVVELFANAVGV